MIECAFKVSLPVGRISRGLRGRRMPEINVNMGGAKKKKKKNEQKISTKGEKIIIIQTRMQQQCNKCNDRAINTEAEKSHAKTHAILFLSIKNI